MTIKIQAAHGVPLAQIARSLGIDRKTARRLRDAPAEPTSPAARRRPSSLARHEQYVRDRLAAGVPAAQIARDLSREGTAIPYSTVRDFARPLRPVKPPAAEEVRFETVPAKQAQCDWSDFGKVLEDGVSRPLCLFVMVLGLLAVHLRDVHDEHERARTAALPPRGVRGVRWRAARSAFRQHEDGDGWPGRSVPADLSARVRRLCRALRVHAQVRATISSEDQRQGRAGDRLSRDVVSSRPHLYRFGRRQRPTRRLAGSSQRPRASHARRSRQ